jgi:hypothetical protein
LRPVLLPAGAAPRPNDALIPHQVPNLSEIRYMTIRYMTIRYMTIRYMTIRYVKKTDAGGVTTAGRSRTRDARAGSRVQAGRARHQLLLKVLLHDRRVPPRRRPTPYARHAQCPLGGHAGGGRRKAAVVKQLAAAHSLVRYGMRRGNDRGGGRRKGGRHAPSVPFPSPRPPAPGQLRPARGGAGVPRADPRAVMEQAGGSGGSCARTRAPFPVLTGHVSSFPPY